MGERLGIGEQEGWWMVDGLSGREKDCPSGRIGTRPHQHWSTLAGKLLSLRSTYLVRKWEGGRVTFGNFGDYLGADYALLVCFFTGFTSFHLVFTARVCQAGVEIIGTKKEAGRC